MTIILKYIRDIHIYACVYVYIYKCLYVHVCVCMCYKFLYVEKRLEGYHKWLFLTGRFISNFLMRIFLLFTIFKKMSMISFGIRKNNNKY